MISSVTVGSKTLPAAAIAAAVLAFAAPAYADRGGKPSTKGGPPAAAATVTVQGVVQSVSGSAVVVRQLDGSMVSVGIARNTHITVDGHPTKVGDVKPGFVLVTTVKAGQAASTMRFLRPG
jgi:hypothetical protein